MSFPKAELKRFNDTKGCAPPVGAYDPNDGKKTGGAVIELAERFKHPKDVGANALEDGTLSFGTPHRSSTPRKSRSRTSSTGAESSVVTVINKRKPPHQVSEHLAKIKELEVEVRRLVREKNDKDKELRGLQQEHAKLEGRLNTANAERTSSLARSAQLDHDAKQAQRSLEALQKQLSSTEVSSKRKEDKHREELQAVQQKIHSKEQEIHTTHSHILQALLSLVKDAEDCAKCTDGLSGLLHKLDISSESSMNAEEKAEGSSSDEGSKQVTVQIKKVRRLIKRVSCSISKLAESGVEKMDAVQSRIQDECYARLQQVSSQLAEAQANHQLLQQQLEQQQQQLEQQQQQHQQGLAEMEQLRNEECNALQHKISQLQEDSQEAQQRLQQIQQEYDGVLKQLQTVQEERHSMETKLQQVQGAMETEIQAEKKAYETLLQTEKETWETLLQTEKETYETLLQTEKETYETLVQTEKETWETLLQTEKETYETLLQTEKETYETLLQTEKETYETRLQAERETLESNLHAEREIHDTKLQAERGAFEAKLHKDCKLLEAQLQLEKCNITEIQKEKEDLEIELGWARSQMYLERQSMEAGFAQEREALERKFSQEKEAMDCEFQHQIDTLGSKLQQEQSRAKRELQQSRDQAEEYRRQTEEKINAAEEVLQEREDSLAVLEENLHRMQEENKTSLQALQEELHAAESKLTQTEKELLQKQVQQEETLMQLQQALREGEKVREQLGDSQESSVRMQQDIHSLQQEVERLKELGTSLQQSRDNLEVESDNLHLAKKELEVKGYLLTDALENMKDEVYGETVTGTPAKAKQLLFEESAERAALEERMHLLDDENKVLNCSIRSLTEKFQNVIRELEEDLKQEKEVSCQMQTRFAVSEQEREKTLKELEETQLMNRDLVQSINLFQDELSHLKSSDHERKVKMENLKHMNGELNSIVKDLHLQLEAEQHATENAHREVQAHAESMEVQVKQHQIAHNALQEKIVRLKLAADRESQRCTGLVLEKQRVEERHREELQVVRKALALDYQRMEAEKADLSHKLERAQTFNNEMKEELKKLLQSKEKLKHDSSAEITALRGRLQTAEDRLTQATNQFSSTQQLLQKDSQETTRLKEMVTRLEDKVASTEEERTRHEATVRDYQSQMAEQEKKLRSLETEKETLELHADKVSEERSMLEIDMEKQLLTLQEAALEERTEFERIISEMSEKIQQLEDENEKSEESDEWREKFEELFARVEPFMEQLDAFNAERNLLLGRNQNAEAEIAKMMDKYAKLLGHQNQKQKIQYINKLKDEYMQCRKEKEALKEKSTKQQNTISKLEKKLQALEGKKTFDPSLAFKLASKKEDIPRSPLRQTNK